MFTETILIKHLVVITKTKTENNNWFKIFRENPWICGNVALINANDTLVNIYISRTSNL